MSISSGIKTLAKSSNAIYNRDVAQLGSALPWGGRGRQFKSDRSDHIDKMDSKYRVLFCNYFLMTKLLSYRVRLLII